MSDIQKMQNEVELLTNDELDAGITQSALMMNSHTQSAEDERKRWLVLRDEQKRRMSK
jgi:hypothetical protein